ncbi:SRPBCC family protein [Pseudalkalibacillus decolorationis]|uniref:SRPBCC family protein n=1 Tax=Pseudalkalibacillus decolorationis TaxID=163879 RepID=UPI0021499319|nr:SRPBCC family protein [Pseudalkalibacillus decolorationis]
MFHSTTLSITINKNPHETYEYIRNPENLPSWLTSFTKSVKKVNDQWVLETLDGPMNIRFVDKNEFGVLDHYVTPTPEQSILNPMRVIPNDTGCEVLFTLFQLLEITDEQFAADKKMVEQDLQTLKTILEKTNL